MDCASCHKEKKRTYKGYCISCFIKTKSGKIHAPKLPKWSLTLSNKILPPLFFFLLAIITLHYINIVDSNLLRVNLGVVSVAASALSVYLTILVL